jgi:hypothetical protein
MIANVILVDASRVLKSVLKRMCERKREATGGWRSCGTNTQTNIIGIIKSRRMRRA